MVPSVARGLVLLSALGLLLPASGFLAGSVALWRASVRCNYVKARSYEKPGTRGGFGSPPTQPYYKKARPNELLLRSERAFKELDKWYTKYVKAQERASAGSDAGPALAYQRRDFIMCARLKGEDLREAASGPGAAISDWLPLNQLVMIGPAGFVADRERLAASAATFARECHCTMTRSVPQLQRIAASTLEYSLETLASFEAHIYPYFEPSAQDPKNAKMAKRDALATLGLGEPPGAAASILGSADVPSPDAIRKAYRSLSKAYHPEGSGARGLGAETDEAKAAKLAAVQQAYRALGTERRNTGGSWYEAASAGAASNRDGFSGALAFAPGTIGVAAEGALAGHLGGGWSQAITTLDPKLSQFFGARHAHARMARDGRRKAEAEAVAGPRGSR